jgi:hypothetical protein
MNNIIQVYNNIFLGTYLNSLYIHKLNDKKISCIIFIGSVNKSEYILNKYIQNIDNDIDSIDLIMNKFIKIIKLNSSKKILIHCSKGFSLSVYVIIFYYINLLSCKKKISKNNFITVNLLNLLYLKNNRITVSDHYINLLLLKEQKLGNI